MDFLTLNTLTQLYLKNLYTFRTNNVSSSYRIIKGLAPTVIRIWLCFGQRSRFSPVFKYLLFGFVIHLQTFRRPMLFQCSKLTNTECAKLEVSKRSRSKSKFSCRRRPTFYNVRKSLKCSKRASQVENVLSVILCTIQHIRLQ